MLERTLLVVAIVCLVVALRWYVEQRQRNQQGQRFTHDQLPLGRPGIIALTTPHCMQCERLQKPALQRVQTQRNDVTIVWRNVADEPELVKQLGILTVPSTVVRSADGTLRHVNLGYTDAQTLLQQLT